MRKNKKACYLLTGLLLVGSLAPLASCSSTSVPQESQGNKTFYIKADKSTLLVGETLELSIIEGKESAEYIYKSSDNSILSCTEDGKVEALKKGSAVVTAYEKDNFENYATMQFFVNESSTSAGKEEKSLEIDFTNAKVEFKQGEAFSTEGLVVKADGNEITNYSTNPRVGTALNSLGELEVVVSLSGYNSKTYSIRVVENQDDYSLYNVVEKLTKSQSYKFNVTVNGQIQVDAQTIAREVIYSYTFSENSYYMKFTADGKVIDIYDFGYINTPNGVLKYRIVDDIMEPLSYASHQSRSYREVSAYKDQNQFNLSTIPLRSSNGRFIVTNGDLTSQLIKLTNISSSTIVRFLKDITGEVTSENSFKFTLDCGQIGTIVIDYSEIGEAKVEIAENAILEEGGDTVIVDSKLEKAANLINNNNFTQSITYVDATNKSQPAGTIYYTQDYYVTEYTEEYIKFNAEQGKTITSNGFFYKNRNIYSFDLTTSEGVTTVGNVKKKTSNKDNLQVYTSVKYPSEMTGLASSNLDMYEYTNIPALGGSAYLNVGDKAPTEIFDFLGIKSTSGLFPMGLGVLLNEGPTDAEAQVALFTYCFDFSGTYYVLGQTFKNFGVTQYKVVADYVAAYEA